MNEPTTPGDVLQALIALFTEPNVPADQRDAARDLDLLLMIDSRAEHDLLDALFHGRKFDVATPAGINHMARELARLRVLESMLDPTDPVAIPWLKFDARPLLDLLKAMPHRDPGLGVSRDQTTDCTVKE